MPHPPCLVCGRENFAPIYEDTLLRCGACGFVTANLAVDESVLRRVYSTYFSDGGEVYDYLGTKDSRQINFARRLALALRAAGSGPVTGALEIGAAYGFFGEVLLRDHPGARYAGIDVSGEAVAHAKGVLGLDVECGDYMRRRYDEPFSHVFMWDVVEHLPNPRDFLAKAHGELAPGGLLVLGTPDIDTPLPRLRGRRWRNIHPPSHLHYFSASTLSALVQGLDFEVRAVLHPPVWRSARLIYHLTLGKRLPNPLADAVGRMVPKGLTIPLNTFDNMILVARKGA